MPLYALDDNIWFPPADEALEDGLLAFGGDLDVERLMLAYRNGIFPWFDGGIPLWWSPDPRCVLFPADLKISHSMKQLLRKNKFEFRINEDFEEVISQCQQVKRKDQPGTWISDEFIRSYTQLHHSGFVESASVYLNGKLVGGLYGVRLGNIFCGESMFSTVSNASKFAFIKYVHHLEMQGVVLVDCQLHTLHLESLGATMIPRSEFLQILRDNISTR